MISYVPITVNSYSGYKADEYPVTFNLNGRQLVVEEITDRWYQGAGNPEFPASDYFRVISEGRQYLLKHDLENDNWFTVINS